MKYLLIILLATTAIFSSEKLENTINSANIFLQQSNNEKYVKCATMHLIDIARNGHLLSEETKVQLKAKGFDFSGNLVVLTRPNLDYFYDSEHFRFHYDIEGSRAVENTDTDGDTVPDYVETMAEVFEEVYDHMINELGYAPPPSDGTMGGSIDAYDIYIQSINYYGLTYWDDDVGDNKKSVEIELNAYSSYMWMRNNYEGVAFAHNTELENIQVTAAHEFFHAIQFGYDGDEELWLLEATATFMEEENYDNVNDCYQYMIPWFEKPHLGLKSSSTFFPYGSYILFKYIDEHYGGYKTIRHFWEQSRLFDSSKDEYSIQELDNALKKNGVSFKTMFNNFAIANAVFSSSNQAGIYSYEEADDYRNYLDYAQYDTVSIELGIHDSLNFLKGMLGTIESTNLQQYGSQYIKINTDSPIKLSLSKPIGSQDRLIDLKLHTIRKTLSGNYNLQSGHVQNIDPKDNTEWIMAVIVADDTNGNNYDYILNYADGVVETSKYFKILSQYPNPFNSTATIKIRMLSSLQVNVIIYDILGRKITKLFKGNLSEGNHDFKWDGTASDGSKVSSGTYYISVQSENHQVFNKITLIK